MEHNLGMAIEHKPTGKYDSEAERVAQPAGFAYMAPPGQSNQYGYWNNSGGQSFWVFYGQYALMRDLLFNRDYRPLGRYEYEDYYRYRQRNQTYYGRDEASGSAPKYGTSGTTTQNRYSGSTFAQKGGFKDSKYAAKPGSYSNSQYATPGHARPQRRSQPADLRQAIDQPAAVTLLQSAPEPPVGAAEQSRKNLRLPPPMTIDPTRDRKGGVLPSRSHSADAS